MNSKLYDVRIVETRQLTTRVREYLLMAVNGSVLPDWTAGAHISLHLTSLPRQLVVRHYSLIGGIDINEDSPNFYRIAVQLEEHGFGSKLIHENLKVGTALRIGPPVDSFALDRGAAKVLLLAGGIGITPFVSMARSLLRRKRAFQLVYSGKSVDQMAYAKNLREMCGEVLRFHCSNTEGRLNINSLLSEQDADTQVYVCGPLPFINAAKLAAKNLNWNEDRLRSEVFISPVLAGDNSFTVSLKQSNCDIKVRCDESLLDALINARIPVYWDCRKGECGLCATKVLSYEGSLQHRDRYLTDEEKKNSKNICLCVSRTNGKSIVLDL